MPSIAALPLSPPVFAILRDLIEDKVGIHYNASDAELLGSKVSARAQEMGFESLLDYYYFLRYDPGGARELQALAEQLVVHETYFWRELDALQMAVKRLIVPRVEAGHRVRVWSAACATGEEPITVALLLDAAGILDGVDILASDLSARALEVARTGHFPRRSLRRTELPDHAAGRLEVLADRTVRVAASIVSRVTWQQLNLLDHQAIAALGTFDLILCRNVLIYFDEGTVRDVVGHLTRALTPDGVLLVGVSESLLRFGTSLECEEKDGVFHYRRADG